MNFKGKVVLGGKTATGIEVPAKIVESLGSGKRPPVNVSINDHSYRSTVAPLGGSYWIPLSAENRELSGVAAGDTVDVDLELDTLPREVEVPRDLDAALKRDKAAERAFEALSYSHKRQHVLAIEEAKKPETRERRIRKAIEMLKEQKSR